MTTPQTSAEMARIAFRGMERCVQLPAEVRAANYGKIVAVSVKTRRYIIGADEKTLGAFTASLAKDDFVWRSRIS